MIPDLPHPPCCLVIEDQTLIAMAIESYPEEAGLSVPSVASLAVPLQLLR